MNIDKCPIPPYAIIFKYFKRSDHLKNNYFNLQIHSKCMNVSISYSRIFGALFMKKEKYVFSLKHAIWRNKILNVITKLVDRLNSFAVIRLT